MMPGFSEQVMAVPLRYTRPGGRVCVEADFKGETYAFAHGPPPTLFEGWEKVAYEMCEHKVRTRLAQLIHGE